MKHAIEHMASIYGKVSYVELNSKTLDAVYGTAESTTYKDATNINAVIVDNSGFHTKKLQQDWGIQVKSTPSILISASASLVLGSRVVDSRTNIEYEVVDLIDQAIHPYDTANCLISYKEYKLRKIQEVDGDGV